MTEPYNPLDLKNLGDTIAGALLNQDVHPLPPEDAFSGSGSYAIYYTGNFEPYRPMARRNREGRFKIPIYVGKGTGKGRQKGGQGFEVPHGRALYSRLRLHARSIGAATNLDLQDFSCRYLVVAPVWVPLAEEVLIRRFLPLWNQGVTGMNIVTKENLPARIAFASGEGVLTVERFEDSGFVIDYDAPGVIELEVDVYW